MFPLSRVPFGVPIFDPQPFHTIPERPLEPGSAYPMMHAWPTLKKGFYTCGAERTSVN